MTQSGRNEQEHTPEKGRPWKLGILISGTGRTLENLMAVIDRGELDAEIACVVSSRSKVRGVAIAQEAGIPTAIVTRKQHPTLESQSEATYRAICPFAPDLLILAGFMSQIEVKPGWEGRMLNIHSALLPQTGAWAAGKGKFGDYVHAAVLEHGDTVSGATVHVVTADYDTGPAVMQREVPVLPGDTVASLGARVFAAECELYPEAIRQYMADHAELRRGVD